MIVAVVRFPLPQPMSVERAAESFEGSAPGFQGVDGLIRKHFLLGDDGSIAGGVYLWESREQAESMYTDTWRERITGKYGPPTVEYFVSPVTVDDSSITVTV